jgi:DNA (cytosine-5)-methyltransferase 1
MMGLPPRWVTGTPLSRAAQLHLLGNSVVPQQAAQALKTLLPEGIRHHRCPRWRGARTEGER